MDIFDILTLIGGLCLFLFGMNVMGDGLERRAGGGLKLLLGKLTNNRMKGFLTGDGGDPKLISNNGYGRWVC